MSGVADALRDVDDADARVVAHLQSVDFTLDYIRDDIASEYSDRDLNEAYHLIMGHLVAGDNFKNLIGQTECHAQTLFFDDIVVFVLPSERYEAVFASFDRHEEFPTTDVIETATRASP